MGTLSRVGRWLRGRYGSVAVVTGAAVLLTACGNGMGQNADDIVIGLVASETGALAATAKGLPELAQGWASWVNQTQGGINGRHVKVIVADDGSSAATGISRVRRLVNKDRVIALVGNFSSVSDGAEPILAQRKIPSMTAIPNTPKWTQSPVFIPLSRTPPNSVIAKAMTAEASGAKKWAGLICAESPACDVTNVWSTVSPKLGLDYFGSIKVAAGAPSYAAQCLAFKQAGVDYVQLGLPMMVTTRVIRDCQQQGYQPKYGIDTLAWDPALLSIPGLQVFGDSYTLPWFADHPALDEYKKLENTYVSQESWRRFTSIASFAALEVFRKAMTQADAEPTAAGVLAAMAALHDENLGGLLPNTLGGFNAGKGPQPALNCYFAAGIDDGEYVIPDDIRPLCVDVTV
ncbi:ABC transporter substrate-binding protein [Nocardia aurea]|uniref:ABC transporter substrate-binding protein n=1 Tax=Nocardia aurea TaxID=2144174 RepID=UPI000D687AB9|nr:ABC transporter substrate-binding protein [Nocardia aurea]